MSIVTVEQVERIKQRIKGCGKEATTLQVIMSKNDYDFLSYWAYIGIDAEKTKREAK